LIPYVAKGLALYSPFLCQLQQKGATSSSLDRKNLNRNPEFNTTNQETYQHWFECFNFTNFDVFASNHKSHEGGIKIK
jgi:hypothetical protein